jgi:hypothetical protein
MGSLLPCMALGFMESSHFKFTLNFITKATQSQEKFKWDQILPITPRTVLPRVERFTATVIPAA